MIYFHTNFFFLLITLFHKWHSYAVLPFKSFNQCNEYNNIKINHNVNNPSDSFVHNCLTNKIYTEMDIGIPKQTVNILLSMKGSSFYLLERFCPNEIMTFYNPNNSNTFKNNSFCTNNFNNILSICDIREKITFYNDITLKSNISINDTNIAFGKGLPNYLKNDHSENICGFIGFSLMNKDISNLLNRFLLLLKFFKVIKEYTWTFHFFDKNNKNDIFYKINNKNDNHEGLFIIGILPHEYDAQIFNKTNYKSALNENRGYTSKWDLKFFEIFCLDQSNNRIKINDDFQGELDIETNYIISTKEYYDLIKNIFFKEYFNKGICVNNTVEVGKNFYSMSNNFYEVISCDINNFGEKERKNFPSLNFFHLKYNFTFTFEYKELFKNIYNRTFFLISTSKNNEKYWSFGKLFMKKYQFVFDTDKKTISFYRKKKYDIIGLNKSSKVKNYIIIFLVSILLSILFGIFIGKRIYKRKKNIVSEMSDDFEYKSADCNSNKNRKVEQNIEMKSKLVF